MKYAISLFFLVCFCFVSEAQRRTTGKGDERNTFGSSRPFMSRDSCRDLSEFDSVQNLLKSSLSAYVALIDSNKLKWIKKTDTLVIEGVDENERIEEFLIGDIYLDQQKNLLKVELWFRQYQSNVSYYYLTDKLAAVSIYRSNNPTVTWYYPLAFDANHFDPQIEHENCILWDYCKLWLKGKNLKARNFKNRD